MEELYEEVDRTCRNTNLVSVSNDAPKFQGHAYTLGSHPRPSSQDASKLAAEAAFRRAGLVFPGSKDTSREARRRLLLSAAERRRGDDISCPAERLATAESSSAYGSSSLARRWKCVDCGGLNEDTLRVCGNCYWDPELCMVCQSKAHCNCCTTSEEFERVPTSIYEKPVVVIDLVLESQDVSKPLRRAVSNDEVVVIDDDDVEYIASN